MQRIILLTGAMGVGKTTLAPLLARALDSDWCDTDALIESAIGVPGGKIIQDVGIEAFRCIEEEVVTNALLTRRGVIATGAGAWTIPSVRHLSSKLAVSIWLRASPEVLATRLRNGNRYLTRAVDVLEFAKHQISERTVYYEMADKQIWTDGHDLGQCVQEILSLLTEHSIACEYRKGN